MVATGGRAMERTRPHRTTDLPRTRSRTIAHAARRPATNVRRDVAVEKTTEFSA
jgi:hypothetical protein